MSAAPENPPPEWLPEGWTMRVRVRNDGKQDKYYTSPSSGCTCRSKPEVMRCVDIKKNSGKATRSTTSRYKKNHKGKQLTDHANKMGAIADVKNSPEWLPPGWIIEIKTRQSGVLAGHQYKCYFDPFTGRRFYSKKELFRYLEFGVAHTPQSNQKRSIQSNSSGGCSNNQSKNVRNKSTYNPPITAKKWMSRGTSVRRGLFHGSVPKSNVTTLTNVDEMSDRPDFPLQSLLPGQIGRDEAGSSCIIPEGGPRKLELMIEKPSQLAFERSSGRPKKHRSRKRRASVNQGCSQRHESAVQLHPRKTKAFKAITFPVRSSKRLAGIKADPVVDTGISGLSRKAMPKKLKHVQLSPAKVSDIIDESPKTSGGGEDELEVSPAVDESILEKIVSKEQPLEKVGSGEQAGAQKLGGESPGSPRVLPFADSWSDPCLEFAVKTLTSDIPALEDTAAMQKYLEQQLVSVTSPSPLNSAPLTFINPVNYSQPELHAQRPVHDRKPCSLENRLQAGGK